VATLQCWVPLVSPMLVHPNCWNTWCIALLGLAAVFGEVVDFPVIVARVTSRCELLWWPDCILLLLLLCWRGVVVLLLLLWAVAPDLWQRSPRLSCGWCVDHAILQRSTSRTASGGSWHGPLSLLLFSRFIGLHGSFLVNGDTR
jgi:hypothetical protein